MYMDWNGGPGSGFTAQPLGRPIDLPLGPTSADDGIAQRDLSHALPARLAAAAAENHELRAEVERLRSECVRMATIQKRLMEALGTNSPDRLVHDVRNVLNERELYRALADSLPE